MISPIVGSVLLWHYSDFLFFHLARLEPHVARAPVLLRAYFYLYFTLKAAVRWGSLRGKAAYISFRDRSFIGLQIHFFSQSQLSGEEWSLFINLSLSLKSRASDGALAVA